MWRIIILTCFAVATFGSVSTAMAGGTVGINHITTTYVAANDLASYPRMAEMLCCHCYKPYRDGSRSYQGVLEVGFCRSHGCYCEGFAKCFP